MKDNNQIIEAGQGDIKYIPATAETLIAQAIEKNVPVDTMERLLNMRRELRAEKAKEDFDRAMAHFQADCPIIEKKSKVSFSTTHYSYASLDEIVRQVKSLLAENGFSYTFDTKQTDNAMTTICKVKHEAGHMEVSEFEIAIDTASKMNRSQQYGAASSYGKRYAFCNAFGILTGDEDTDASTPPKPVTRIDEDGLKHEPVDNGYSTQGAKQGTAVKTNLAENACPACNAPKGRLHATKCSFA